MDELVIFVKPVMAAIQSGDWPLVIALAVIASVSLIKKFGGDKIPWLKTDEGGATLVLITAITGAIGNSLASGAPLNWGLILTGVKVGFTAAGGYAVTKKILKPLFAKFGLNPPASVGSMPTPIPAVEVTPIPATMGAPTDAQRAALESLLASKGYVKQADGSFKDTSLVKP
jgi:hypothetical protein